MSAPMESDRPMPASSVSAEMSRRDALIPGTLVWFDSMAGSIPCRIVDRRSGRYSTDADSLLLKVTGNGGPAYPRGLVFPANVGPFVRARAALR
jgi:hypothetical protein